MLNKKQWIAFIVGIISIIVFWIIVIKSSKYGVFWVWRVGSVYDLNLGLVIFLFLLIIGVFAFIIWAIRTKHYKDMPMIG